MHVNEVFDNSAALSGTVLEIKGIFVLLGEVGYFVSAVEDRDNQKLAIRVAITGLKGLAIKHAPPSGGSQYYFLDEAVIAGQLARCSEGNFPFEISNVTSLKISKSGHIFAVV